MKRSLITLSICAAVAAMCGWPLAWLMATFGGGGYASLLDRDVLFGLGMSICLGMLVGVAICGVQKAARAGRVGRS